MVTVEELTSRLASVDVPEQVSAVERAAGAVETLAVAVVGALGNGPNRFLVAERLHRFGSVLVPHLKNLMKTTSNQEARILGALVLLQLENDSGVPVLLAAVEGDSEYAGLCATHLARAQVGGAEAAIISRLASARIEDTDLVVSLILALKAMNCELPADLAKRFNQDGVSWQVRTLL